MGYTHYFYRKPELPRDAFVAAASDIAMLIKRCPCKIRFDYDDIRPPVADETMIRFNGYGFSEGLEDSLGHETFLFQRNVTARRTDYIESKDHPGFLFGCCKTARKPYDLMVVASLIVLKKRMPWEIILSSDGSFPWDWQAGIDFVEGYLGPNYVTLKLLENDLKMADPNQFNPGMLREAEDYLGCLGKL